MAALSQSRALAGCRAFTTLRPRAAARISNGGKVFMRRNDSYMVEVTVGEEEPEDIAIRRYMKAVMDSRVLDQLRARKVKETKIEAYKRRLRERHEMRKSEFEWPTYDQVEGVDMSPKVFDEFFSLDPDGEFGLTGMSSDDFMSSGSFVNDGMWGGYMDSPAGAGNWEGGYMDTNAGGYINPQQQGGYIGAGGYVNTPGYDAFGAPLAAGAEGYGEYAAQPDYYANPVPGQDQGASQGQPQTGYDSQGNTIYTFR